jgi:hypothetical protein
VGKGAGVGTEVGIGDGTGVGSKEGSWIFNVMYWGKVTVSASKSGEFAPVPMEEQPTSGVDQGQNN